MYLGAGLLWERQERAEGLVIGCYVKPSGLLVTYSG